MKNLIVVTLSLLAMPVLAGEPAPRVIAAPTMSELGLIVLAVGVGIAGGIIARRKK
jgi:NADH:ubiquinone oxidoreductase subunit 5 (subunit L)/multisubunit Na+/H+ antiporter MnhA subunit